MKKTRVLIALLLVVLLSVGMPLSALAATHDVASVDDVLNVVATDTDAEVTMNMQNDIDMEHYCISGNEGQSYTINGNGNAISNVVVDAGDVTINADVEDDAIFLEQADVAVNGDVESVFAYDESQVDITGDVGHVDASDEAVVDVTGDVVGDDEYWASIRASENAQVSVDGDVLGYDGVIAPEDMDDPEASENGGVGIEVSDEAAVTVTGNVTGGDGVMSDAAMQEPMMYGDGGDAISASGNATVTVGGDVAGGDAMGTYAYAGDGVNAWGASTVTVEGNVSGGNVVADPEVEPVIEEEVIEETGETYEMVWNSQAGDGITADSTATVTVGGDVTGGSTNANNGVGGNGLYIEGLYEDPEVEEQQEVGTITIGGTVSGGTGDADSEYGGDGVDVFFGGVVGYTESVLEKFAKMDAEDFMDEEGNMTNEFGMMMNALYTVMDEEKMNEAFDQWLEDSGYMDADPSQWTEEEMKAFEMDYLNFMIDLYAAEVEAQNVDVEELNEAYGVNEFAELSIGEYDEDPTFGSYDDGEGAFAAAYMDENVKPLPVTATTPATGDNFNLVLVSTVAILALLGMAAMVVIRKKHA